MKTLNHSYLSRLDHLRFFAVILVIFHHNRGTIDYSGSIDRFADLFALWLRWGSTGVSLFLVLSGFLFCLIADAGKKEISYGRFVKNRILRIAPLTTLMVFIVICIDKTNSTPLDVLRLLTLQLNTGSSYTGWGHNFYPTGPIWTIAVEFQFYLLFPFLAIFLARDGIKTLLGISAVFILIKYSIVILNNKDIYYSLYHSIIGRLDQFLIGMLAGYLYLNGYYKNRLLVPLLLMVLSLIGITLFMHINAKMLKGFIPFSFTIEAFFWALLIYGYLCLRLKMNSRIDAIIAYLGSLSFSMYLLHLPVAQVLYMTLQLQTSSKIDAILNSIVYHIPVTILLSAITYQFIEKPFLSLRVKYIR